MVAIFLWMYVMFSIELLFQKQRKSLSQFLDLQKELYLHLELYPRLKLLALMVLGLRKKQGHQGHQLRHLGR